MSDLPDRFQRYPTRAAIDTLAARFGLPNTPDMQDWEHQVADPARIGEFWTAYESGELDDDEKFTLMETVLESFETLAADTPPAKDPRWHEVLSTLDRSINLHIATVWYWSCWEEKDQENLFHISPDIRRILAKHQERFSISH